MSWKKRLLFALLAAFLVIQFFPPVRNSGPASTAQDIQHFFTVPADVDTILHRSCYDCHSDHTAYPWYTNIQPVGWWMQHHVNEGKGDLNFSRFAQYGVSKQMRRFSGISRAVKGGGMPLSSYLWIHHDAKLSDAQKTTLVTWADQQRKALEERYPDSIPPARPKHD